MLAFKDLQLSDKKMFDEYCGMWRIENSELSFPSLYIWRGSGMVQWAEEDGVLYIKIKWGVLEGPEHFYALIPRCDQPLCGAMQKAVDYCREERIPFVMRGVPQWLYEMIVRDCPDQYVIEEDRDNFDYVYRWEDLAELKARSITAKGIISTSFCRSTATSTCPSRPIWWGTARKFISNGWRRRARRSRTPPLRRSAWPPGRRWTISRSFRWWAA